MKKIYLLFIMNCFVLIGFTQRITPNQYIDRYAPIAIEESKRTGIPASITIAQGILESESGNSDLALRSNNHFGIKCKETWQGEKVYHDDDARGECFRKYTTIEASYRDHSDFLKNGPRYAFLFELNKSDYKGWAKGLKKAGYATNPLYAQKLIDLIEKYNLQVLDNSTKSAVIQEDAVISVVDVVEEKITPGTPEAVKSTEPVLMKESQSSAADTDKIIYINETKAILAPAGTAWLAIAEKYDLTLSKLLDFNDIKKTTSDILNKDQLVFLQRKRKQGANAFHLIKADENLYEISQIEGIRLDNLLKINNLSIDAKAKVGEKLILKSK